MGAFIILFETVSKVDRTKNEYKKNNTTMMTVTPPPPQNVCPAM